MSKWAIRSKKWVIHSFTHFGWATWAIRSHFSFLVSEMSKSLVFVKLTKTVPKNMILVNFFWANRLFFVSEWVNERFAHSCSFVLRDLSKSLTVAHLIWAMSKWAMSKWAMSDWANSQPWLKVSVLCIWIQLYMQPGNYTCIHFCLILFLFLSFFYLFVLTSHYINS